MLHRFQRVIPIEAPPRKRRKHEERKEATRGGKRNGRIVVKGELAEGGFGGIVEVLCIFYYESKVWICAEACNVNLVL